MEVDSGFDLRWNLTCSLYLLCSVDNHCLNLKLYSAACRLRAYTCQNIHRNLKPSSYSFETKVWSKRILQIGSKIEGLRPFAQPKSLFARKASMRTQLTETCHPQMAAAFGLTSTKTRTRQHLETTRTAKESSRCLRKFASARLPRPLWLRAAPAAVAEEAVSPVATTLACGQ